MPISRSLAKVVTATFICEGDGEAESIAEDIAAMAQHGEVTLLYATTITEPTEKQLLDAEQSELVDQSDPADDEVCHLSLPRGGTACGAATTTGFCGCGSAVKPSPSNSDINYVTCEKCRTVHESLTNED